MKGLSIVGAIAISLPLAAAPALAQTTIIKERGGYAGDRRVVIERERDFDRPRGRDVVIKRYRGDRDYVVRRHRGDPEYTGSVRTRRVITRDHDDF